MVSAGLGTRTRGFQPTQQQRDWVVECVQLGVPHRRVAELLKISRTTLVKHFAFELQSRRAVVLVVEPIDQDTARRRLEALVALFEAAMRGNASAQKAFLRGVR